MQNRSFAILCALLTLAILWTPTSNAAVSPPDAAPVLEQVYAPSCSVTRAPEATFSTALPFESTIFEAETAAFPTGCTQSICHKSCIIQGFDFGVCLGTTCFCRFYL